MLDRVALAPRAHRVGGMYRGRFGIVRRLRKLMGIGASRPPPARDPQPPPPGPAGGPAVDLKGAYIRHVENVRSLMSHDEAMSVAVGGGFETVGPIEAALLRHYGLQPDGYVIDVGCGSGRLAKPLSAYLNGPYLGIDLVPALLDHARSIVERPDWRFERVEHIGIPEEDGRADMVVFFSVLTHLLHEQGYWYLEEARRVLKPGAGSSSRSWISASRRTGAPSPTSLTRKRPAPRCISTYSSRRTGFPSGRRSSA
ncbi:class I SAM-dependent methyltransferase [Phenylobacterium sp.]|uniref:class I SAM-dependent methyltransferase n=1 Tax=Phenylobacterium sp. TaxID=1871053 RepID=UPI0039838DA3